MTRFSRRDFLKLSAALTLSMTSKPARLRKDEERQLPNIVVLVCDAMSARNLSLYGYPRQTTPNLEKIAARSFVYHNHYASGSFTTVGVSSLLTGLQPWTHRATNPSGLVKQEFSQHNIFHFLGSQYFKMAHTQNYWANYLLNQCSPDIDSLLPFSEFSTISMKVVNEKFKTDSLLAYRAFEKMAYYGNSILLNFIADVSHRAEAISPPTQDFPLGFPATHYDDRFTIKDLFLGIANKITELDARESPFFAYFHIFPPHAPYRPQKYFIDLFAADDYAPIAKHQHPLSTDASQARLDEDRRIYDAFIANLDHEIGKLVETLDERRILEQTYFIITSDHGEMFERGVYGHFTPLLYEPVIRVPLVVLPPGNTARRDFLSPTSSIDILPTLLKIAKQDIPVSVEGNLLPGLGGAEDLSRAVFALDAKESPARRALTKATSAVIKEGYKLIRYQGYKNKYGDYFELYNLSADPEEMRNLYLNPKYSQTASMLKEYLLNAVGAADEHG